MRKAIIAMSAMMAMGAIAAAEKTRMVAIEPEPEQHELPRRRLSNFNHKPSGSQPVAGGGNRERQRRLARMKKAERNDHTD